MSLCGYFLTTLIILKQCSSAAELSAPPAPTLSQTAVRGSYVELICQAPQGYGGLVFKLYKIRELIDTVEYSTKRQSSRFVLRGKDTEKENLYCCQYGNSMYSFYMQPEVVSLSPLPSPHLMVEPSSGHVTPGETLSFHCQAPPDHWKHPPEAFLLLRSAKGTSGSIVAPAKLVSQSQEAHFSVKTMGREDSGEYVCLYQLKLPKTGQVNSTASQPVHITVIELPVPTLSLSRHEGEVLECVGSPSYLQDSLFSLFRVGVLSPEATHQASPTQHSARFPIPTHYEHGAEYQCQYSVSLDNYRAYSKMSMPVTLPCIAGHHSCTQTSTGSTDLALIVGSVSAGVLFLMAVLLLGFAVHRHIKNTSERRRKREQEKLWLHVHSRDHIPELTLERVDIGSLGVGGTLRGRPSDSEAIYDCPMTTFKNPSFC